MNKPYVYIIQNKDRTHWYVGMRSANRCPANEDTGYWGSSTYLDKLIAESGKENWTKTIVNEFDGATEASEHEIELLELLWDLPGRVNKSINGYVDQSDPEVKAKHRTGTKIGAQKRLQDPVSRANLKTGAQKRSEDPSYRANLKAANQKSAQNPEHRANRKAATTIANQKRAKPFIATCIATSEEYFCESQYCYQVKQLGLHGSAISNCLNGKAKQHKGFTFRYP